MKKIRFYVKVELKLQIKLLTYLYPQDIINNNIQINLRIN